MRLLRRIRCFFVGHQAFEHQVFVDGPSPFDFLLCERCQSVMMTLPKAHTLEEPIPYATGDIFRSSTDGK